MLPLKKGNADLQRMASPDLHASIAAGDLHRPASITMHKAVAQRTEVLGPQSHRLIRIPYLSTLSFVQQGAPGHSPCAL